MQQKKRWALILGLLVAVSGVLALWLGNLQVSDSVANVYQNGELVDTFDLRKIKEPLRKTYINEEGHTNTVLVEPGQISMESADCPDQVCVHHAPISNSVSPIVCLPNRLVIRIESRQPSESGIDALTK